MLKKLVFCLVIVSLFAFSVPAQNGSGYPKAKKVEQVDNFHGTLVRDPFRWLEDTKSADTQSWIEAQNKVSDAYLANIPQRDALRKRFTELWNYERYSAPSKITSGFYIYSKNDGLQNQNVLYRANSITDPGKVFFDPNKLSEDGTVAYAGGSFTDDGKLWAYAIARSGSDRTEWKVMNTETGEHLPDTLAPNRQGGISWLKDNSGFYYSRFPDAEAGSELKGANKFQKIYFHKLGTPQSEDYVVYERPENGELFMGGGVTEDGNWLVISVSKGTERMNEIHFKDLTKEKSAILPLAADRANSYSFIGNDGPVFYFRTDKDAERGRVVSVNVSDKDYVWKEIVPQAE